MVAANPALTVAQSTCVDDILSNTGYCRASVCPRSKSSMASASLSALVVCSFFLVLRRNGLKRGTRTLHHRELLRESKPFTKEEEFVLASGGGGLRGEVVERDRCNGHSEVRPVLAFLFSLFSSLCPHA